jgi:hypothetical protein
MRLYCIHGSQTALRKVHPFVLPGRRDLSAEVTIDAPSRSAVPHSLFWTEHFFSDLNGSTIYKQLDTCYITALVRGKEDSSPRNFFRLTPSTERNCCRDNAL